MLKKMLIIFSLILPSSANAIVSEVAIVQSGKSGIVTPGEFIVLDQSKIEGLRVCVLSSKNKMEKFEYGIHWLNTNKTLSLLRAKLKNPSLSLALDECGLLEHEDWKKVLGVKKVSGNICFVKQHIGSYLYDSSRCEIVFKFPKGLKQVYLVDGESILFSQKDPEGGVLVYSLNLNSSEKRFLFKHDSYLTNVVAWKDHGDVYCSFRSWDIKTGERQGPFVFEGKNKKKSFLNIEGTISGAVDGNLLIVGEEMVGLAQYSGDGIKYIWEQEAGFKWAKFAYDKSRNILALIGRHLDSSAYSLLVVDEKTGEVFGEKEMNFAVDSGLFFFDQEGFLHVFDKKQFSDHIMSVSKTKLGE